MKTVMTLIYCVTISLLASIALSETKLDEGITAITIPSADITLSFLQPGRIDKIGVKEGDKVKADALVMEQYKAAEEALLAQKNVDLKRLVFARKRGASTDLEVEHAQLEVKIAGIRVDNMKLVSPIDGFVENIYVEVGESIQALAEAIRIVRIDPLWIDVHVPQNKANTVKVGDTATVKFPKPQMETSSGKVIFVSRTADAASSTLRARIEVANKSNRPAGESVRIVFVTSKPKSAGKDINKARKNKEVKLLSK
ncbi:MAG: efflux RND transporter periplasmic adaptor subunit [Planctomycetes bacterium]|nr:efflux RND transporter periplasmic adaptor subunit [Planctomycetota bacterium]